MNPEMYAYTLVVALIGMTTVFVGLTLLSLMMVLLRRMFGTEARQNSTPTPIDGSTLRDTADTRWVLAAAAAFLDAEENQSNRTAADWKPGSTESNGQWSIQPRL
jgi:Na+-transporting methylmalonyl-CoA/oxaloacetate decarboxylase gamma subunit